MSDTNVGMGMVPHKTNCRCDECQIVKLERELAAANKRVAELEADLSTSKSLRSKNERLRMMLRSVEKRNRTLEKQTDKAHNKEIYAHVDVVHLQQEVKRLREALGEAYASFRLTQNPTDYGMNHWSMRWRDLASGKESV